MNSKDVAKHLGVTVQTLRIWQKIFNIKVPYDDKGNKFYDENTIKLLEQIKVLKAENKEIEDIKNELHINMKFSGEFHREGKEFSREFPESMKAIIKAEIQDQTLLSENYAKATYQIGKLEAEKKALEDKIKLLPDLENLTELKLENLELKQQLQQAHNEICLLKMPWYKRLFIGFRLKEA